MDNALLMRVLHAVADVRRTTPVARGLRVACRSQYSVIGIPLDQFHHEVRSIRGQQAGGRRRQAGGERMKVDGRRKLVGSPFFGRPKRTFKLRVLACRLGPPASRLRASRLPPGSHRHRALWQYSVVPVVGECLPLGFETSLHDFAHGVHARLDDFERDVGGG